MKIVCFLLLIFTCSCSFFIGKTPRQIEMETLRVRASSGDVHALWDVAVLELLSSYGDSSIAKDAIEKALQAFPKDSSLKLLRAFDAYFHGNILEALDGFLQTIEHLKEDPQPYIGEIAAFGLVKLIDVAPMDEKQVITRIQQVIHALDVPSRFRLYHLLMMLARKHGDKLLARELLKQAGCSYSWKAIGPFPFMSGFDRDHGVLGLGAMKPFYHIPSF